jgi:putative ABC transport system permease protein
MSVQELNNNKLRSSLSLIGIAFGIFCIIGVLATVSSLEDKVQTDIKSLGTNTIYIDKWEYGGGGNDYPWWKYVNRPQPKYADVKFIKESSSLAKYVSYFNRVNTDVSYENIQINGVTISGVSEDFSKIQQIDILAGRYLGETEFIRGNPVGVIGHEIAEEIFGDASKALDKSVSFDGKKVKIIGVIKKQGQSFANLFDYDHSLFLTYQYFASIYDVNSNNTNPFIMVNAADNVPIKALIDELEGIMRRSRRLSPKQEDNFALNDINLLTQQVSGFFDTVDLGGGIIAFLSLVVGLFGVANIMFVTVRERTSQIGLKKAIGAKRRTILLEFLLESAFLCIVGGFFGLLMVWVLALVLSGILPFPIFISINIVGGALALCIFLGVLSGIIPAFIAARMNPVVAIRSTR